MSKTRFLFGAWSPPPPQRPAIVVPVFLGPDTLNQLESRPNLEYVMATPPRVIEDDAVVVITHSGSLVAVTESKVEDYIYGTLHRTVFRDALNLLTQLRGFSNDIMDVMIEQILMSNRDDDPEIMAFVNAYALSRGESNVQPPEWRKAKHSKLRRYKTHLEDFSSRFVPRCIMAWQNVGRYSEESGLYLSICDSRGGNYKGFIDIVHKHKSLGSGGVLANTWPQQSPRLLFDDVRGFKTAGDVHAVIVAAATAALRDWQGLRDKQHEQERADIADMLNAITNSGRPRTRTKRGQRNPT